MYKKGVELKNKERYLENFRVNEEKLDKAIDVCLKKIRKNGEEIDGELAVLVTGWNHRHPSHCGFSLNCYAPTQKVDWINGMWTGLFFTAYNYTKDEYFKNEALRHMPYYIKEANEEVGLNDHDTGFKYIPSCIAAYEMFGIQEAKEAALKAAEVMYDHYCEVNKFIIRAGKREDALDPGRYPHYRTLVDTMMNISLFFWAYEQTGDKKYYDAGLGHYQTTAKYLIREDGSSYHHFQFDPVTFAPVEGKTLQGNRDESCWSRGHSWLVYGYPVAYKHTKDEEIFDIHEAVTNFTLSNLPSDYIPYWDYDFTDGAMEPRDSSAAAITACGLLEMCKLLKDDDEKKVIYQNAANRIVDSLIDHCAVTNENQNSLITHVVGSKPHSMAVDTGAIYADYFYFEALLRLKNPDFKTLW